MTKEQALEIIVNLANQVGLNGKDADIRIMAIRVLTVAVVSPPQPKPLEN